MKVPLKKILFIDNTAHHMYGQLHNILAIKAAGYQVMLLIPDDGVYFKKLQGLDLECCSEINTWKGQNPIHELKLFFKLNSFINKFSPNLICSFTIKPNLYTAILLKDTSIKQISNVTGLGYAFMGSQIKVKVFKLLYRYAISGIDQIFFQNKDDYDYLKNLKIFSNFQNITVLPGSGIDLAKFAYFGLQKKDNLKFLFSGRLLADKGIFELVAAFIKVKAIYSNVELIFIGNYFPDNPSAISPNQIQQWQEDGVITYLGMVDDVTKIIQDCDCAILPSYREGMPRSLLEASSMGKPIITVDSPGCHDVVEDGVTGYLAKVKDVDSLVEVMLKFIELPFEEKVKMGVRGRKKMELEFDQKIVVDKYLSVVTTLL